MNPECELSQGPTLAKSGSHNKCLLQALGLRLVVRSPVAICAVRMDSGLLLSLGWGQGSLCQEASIWCPLEAEP